MIATERENEKGPLRGRKVLVAEDDPSTLRIIRMVLARQGIEVITAEDGEEAFQKVVQEEPDAILLDIHMPKMNGLQLCLKLKARDSTAAIPVGFLTAEKDLGSFKQAREMGSVLYIIKPFKPERLVDAVGVLLSARRRAHKE